MPKAKPLIENHATGKIGGHAIMCPACKHMHVFTSKDSGRALAGGPSWDFNGDLEKPTFSPSMLVYVTPTGTNERKVVCHSFVRDGMIQFLDDCPHALRGQTVPLPEVDE